MRVKAQRYCLHFYSQCFDQSHLASSAAEIQLYPYGILMTLCLTSGPLPLDFLPHSTLYSFYALFHFVLYHSSYLFTYSLKYLLKIYYTLYLGTTLLDEVLIALVGT